MPLLLVPLENAPVISEGDVDIVSIDYTPYLDASETLASVSAPSHVSGPATPTYSNQVVNTVAVEIQRRTVAIGKAVQFKVAGQTASTTVPYYVDVTAVTNSTPARTKKVRLPYWVE